MLGREICAYFSAEHEVLALDIKEIDIRDRQRTLALLGQHDLDLIINSAVMVDVDACERQPQLAWQVNALGAQNVALAAARTNATLIYISTDYVFDGTSTHDYREYDTTNPINVYGSSKLYGEILSRNLCRKLYIVRSSWLFGESPANYVARILRAAHTGPVAMSDDQLEAPTYTRHLAQALQHLLHSGCYGTYHFTGGDGCTRVEFAQAVLQEAGVKVAVKVMPPSEAIKKRIASRPHRIVLDTTLYRMTTAAEVPSWRIGIQEYLQQGQH